MVATEPVDSFLDTFLVVDALIVIAVVIIDLSLSGEARVTVTARARNRLASLKRTSAAEVIASSSAQFARASARVFGVSALSPRFVVLALVANALAGSAVLFIDTFARDASVAIDPTVRFFALPAIVCGYLALAVDHWQFAILARQSSLPAQLSVLLLGLLAALVLWLALMHGGAWLEWQHKRTPLAYGSEWFYAEVYWHYLREPAGRSISLAAGVVVAWPLALLAGWVGVLFGLKLVCVPLEYLLTAFQQARRGVFAFSGICIGALAKLIQAAIEIS